MTSTVRSAADVLRLEATDVVELVGPFVAAGPQSVPCGHRAERGDLLYEVRSAAGAVGMLCATCVVDVAARCSTIDLPVW